MSINGERCQDSFNYHSYRQNARLGVISLTPAVAAMLGRLLPELSSLQELRLTGPFGSRLQGEEMVALFGGLNKTVSLYRLTCMYGDAGGCFFPLFRSFRFFPNLVWLQLNHLNLDENDLCGLLESFQFIPNLERLDLSYNPLGHSVTSIVPHVINLKKLRYLEIINTGSSEEDLKFVQQALLYHCSTVLKEREPCEDAYADASFDFDDNDDDDDEDDDG